MTMKKNITMKKNFATLVIIFVTLITFIAGFTQTGFFGQTETIQEELSQYQEKLRKTRELTNQIIEYDLFAVTQSAKLVFKAVQYAREYYLGASTFTFEENLTYQIRIANDLYDAETWMLNTYLYDIDEYFFDNPEASEMVFADTETYGVEVIFKESIWNKYEPIYYTEMSELLISVFDLPLEIVVDLFNAVPWIPYSMPRARFQNFREVMQTLTTDIQVKITELQQELLDLTTLTERIALGISVVTIATILSMNMSDRIDEKETEYDFSVIRADITKKEYKKRSKELLSILVLVLAVIIAVVGLILPLVLP